MVDHQQPFPDVSGSFKRFLAGLPKAELHLHIEGTLTPDLKWKIAQRNRIRLPYANAKEMAAAQKFEAPDAPTYLRKFLHYYFEGLSVLRTVDDYYEITIEHLKTCQQENVRYVEIMFDPQPHIENGVPFEVVFEGLDAARREGVNKFGVESNFILSINRDRSLDSAVAALNDAKPYRDRIVGFGLDSVEEGNPPSKFQKIYDQARSEGYRLTAHCDVDQADAVSHIWECLNLLKVERIDHGINAIEDPQLIDRLRELNICLTPCPTWRPIDKTPRRVDRIRTMYELGLKVTLNTDDPGLFTSGTMATLLPPVAAAGNFDRSDMVRFMKHAFEGAWLSAEQKAAYVDELETYAANTRD